MEEDVRINTNKPDVSKRVWMVTQILRPSTAQMVIRTSVLYLPDDHPLLAQITIPLPFKVEWWLCLVDLH